MATQCPNYSWDLFIDSSVTGDIALDGMYTIVGGLFNYNDSVLNSVSSTALERAGEINILGSPNLRTVDFPSVTAIPAQQMGLYSLPSLTTLNINQTGLFSLELDNTGLGPSFSGLGPGSVPYGSGIGINGNPNLRHISLGISHLDNNPSGGVMGFPL